VIKEILPLTGLRFIAAFYVFLFHIHIRWPLTSHVFIKNILDQGAIGMSLFFILSGFVLVLRYGDLSHSYKNYIINRIARIYPVYIIAAVVTLPWMGIAFETNGILQIIMSVARVSFLVGTNIFLLQAWFPQFFTLWNDGGSWSISVEAFCYSLLPLIIARLSKLSKRQLYSVSFACYCIAVLPGLSVILFNSSSHSVFYSMPIFRLPEFVLGGCICLLSSLDMSKFAMTFKQFVVIFFFLVYLGFIGPQLPFLYVVHNWVALPVIGFIILSLTTEKGLLTSLLSSKSLVWLGKISYGFYSFQALLILLLVTYHDRWVELFPFLSNNIILALVSFLILTLISAGSYYFIEEPSRHWIKKQFLKRQSN